MLRRTIKLALCCVGALGIWTAASAAAIVSATLGVNFPGIAQNGSTWRTADPSGAVGATQYVQWVNDQFAVFDKTTGNLTLGPLNGASLWRSFVGGGSCQTYDGGDPTVLYDKAAKVWVLSHHATPSGGPSYQCIAVSTTSDATGSYNLYAFQLPTTYFPDWPRIGVWSDGYYLTYNEQDPTNHYVAVNTGVCALQRARMLLGQPASMQCFEAGTPAVLVPADIDGLTAPPAGLPNYLMSRNTNSVDVWTFHVDWVTPSNSQLSGPVNIPVATYTPMCPNNNGVSCVPQPGTTQHLDSISDRLMYRLAYRNRTTYQSLLVTQTVSGGAVRWYEFRIGTAGVVSLFQQGTFRPDSTDRWDASIAMDQVGDIAMGYNVSSSAVYPSIRFTGRVPSNGKGSMQGEQTIVTGSASQQRPYQAWADLTTLSVDPVDDCTFWYTAEYHSSNNLSGWSTQIASFKFPTCH